MKEQRIKNQIRRLRFEANEMTQAELAEKASVKSQLIIVNGVSNEGKKMSFAECKCCTKKLV